MWRIASLFLLQKLKGSMSGDAHDFNNIEMRAVIKFYFFLQGKAPKEIHAILAETLGEHAPSYATVNKWVTQFKRGDFSTCDAPRPGRPKTVTTPEIIDQIDLVGRTTFWIFLVACKGSKNGLRSVLSFVGNMLNKSRVWSL